MRRLRFEDLGVAPGCADTHVTRLEGRCASEPHTHDFHEAFLVLAGEGTHHLNGRRIALRAGHLALIRPDDAHWYSTAPAQTLVFVNVAVSRAWWSAFHALLGPGTGKNARRNTSLDPGATRRLGAELNATALTNQPLAAVQAWSRVHASLAASPRRRQDAPPPWLEALRRRFAETPEELVEPIAFWQRLAGRSPEHLARCSRRFYGVTFSELLNRARIERARYLLRATDEKIISVAFGCGFQNLAHFYRVFARLSGCAPSQWRNEKTRAVPFDASTSA